MELWRIILGKETPFSLVQNLLLFHIRQNSPFVSLLLSFFLPFLSSQISLLRTLLSALVETVIETPSLILGCNAFASLLSPPFHSLPFSVISFSSEFWQANPVASSTSQSLLKKCSLSENPPFPREKFVSTIYSDSMNDRMRLSICHPNRFFA